MSLRIAPHILDALHRREAVVALESTVITHGLPRPQNLTLALGLEGTVREAGAVPATIALVGGELVVGLDRDEIEALSRADAAKASMWNLAALAAGGADAGTTVATTLHAAYRAGIQVFATGGIGGVHPHPFDESADLAALARYPLVTVCAGPKSILDAAATRERLESLGVTLVGYRSDLLAGFHVRETTLPVPSRCDTPAEVAAVFGAARDLDLPAGLLVSNPVSSGLEAEELAGYLRAAQADADRQGVRGKEITPFLLERLAELSRGRTVEVNLRLLHENAALAAALARALTTSSDATLLSAGVQS